MRDNSEMSNVTKVNTETGFQPKCGFKKGSICARICRKFSVFSHIDKGLWQFWSLEGLVLMTSATIKSQEWFNFLDKSDEEVNDSPSKYDWLKLVGLRFSHLINKFSSETSLKQVSFADILNDALPLSSKIIEFNNLIQDIRTIKTSNQNNTDTFSERDDSKVFEAITLLSNIIDTHWNEFSLESKVLLLGKLRKFNKNKNLFIFEIILQSFIKIPGKLKTYFPYILEFLSSTKQGKQNITAKTNINLNLLSNAILSLLRSTQKAFDKDGKLLYQNKGSINKFVQGLRAKIWENEILEEVRQCHANNYKGLPRLRNALEINEYFSSLLDEEE